MDAMVNMERSIAYYEGQIKRQQHMVQRLRALLNELIWGEWVRKHDLRAQIAADPVIQESINDYIWSQWVTNT